jgi:hypothetical protein
MIFDLIVMIAACIAYSVGMEYNFKFKNLSDRLFSLDTDSNCKT